MTAPIEHLSITIRDDGTVSLFAAQSRMEGQVHAIKPREISVAMLRAIAEAAGPDVSNGVENRLREVLEYQRSIAAGLAAAAERAASAQARVDQLAAKVDESKTID